MTATAEKLEGLGTNPVVDISSISTKLGARLKGFTSEPLAATLCALVGEDPLPLELDIGLAVEYSQKNLGPSLVVVSEECKDEMSSRIRSGYPEDSDDLSRVQTPRNLTREYSLKGYQRLAAFKAHSDAIESSREELLGEIAADTFHEGLSTLVTEDTLKDGMALLARTVQSDIDTLVAELSVLIPHTSARQVAGSILRKVGINYRYDAEFDNSEITMRLSRLKDLVVLVKSGVAGFAQVNAAETADLFRSEINANYGILRSDAISRIPDRVKEAYSLLGIDVAAQAAGKTAVEASFEPRVPRSIRKRSRRANQNHGDPEIDDFSSRLIGEIPNPFEWAVQPTAEFNLVSGYGSNLLFTKAMSHYSTALSEKLRDGDDDIGSYLDVFMNRILAIELSSNSLSHSRLGTLTGADFYSLNIRYFKQNGTPKARLYYANTNARQFPRVSTLAGEAGLSLDTRLIVFVAEANKSTEFDLLVNEFNYSKSFSRAHRSAF